jgi:anti-anti-sigma factor
MNPTAAAPMTPVVREVRIHGAVEEGDLALLMDHLDDLVQTAPDRVVVDLSTCPSLDAGAVGVLVQANERLREHGAIIDLRGSNAQVVELLRTEGVIDLFDYSPAKPLAKVLHLSRG